MDDLSDDLKQALCHLGDEPTITVVPWGMIRELIARGLIESHGSAGVRFTESGRKLFHELRGEPPKRNL